MACRLTVPSHDNNSISSTSERLTFGEKCFMGIRNIKKLAK